jgi:hypothetical protein
MSHVVAAAEGLQRHYRRVNDARVHGEPDQADVG